MNNGDGIYHKILSTPAYMGVLSSIIACIFHYNQQGLLLAFGITAILYTFKNKRTMNIGELFIYTGSWGLFSFLMSIITIFLNKEVFAGNILNKIFQVIIWMLAQIAEGVFIFFFFGLIVSSIIVLFSGNKQKSRFLKFIEFWIKSPFISGALIIGLIYLAKLYL